MKPPIFPLGAVLTISLLGCGGEETAEPAGETVAEAMAETPGEPAGDRREATPENEGLFKRWGPDQMPDRNEEPLQFFYWRIDKMFTDFDANDDGKLEPHEFAGPPENFERIDRDGDGFLTKRELVDDGAHRVVEPGGVSEP